MCGSGWQEWLEVAGSADHELKSCTLPPHTVVSSLNAPAHHVSPPPHPLAVQEALDTAQSGLCCRVKICSEQSCSGQVVFLSLSLPVPPLGALGALPHSV